MRDVVMAAVCHMGRGAGEETNVIVDYLPRHDAWRTSVIHRQGDDLTSAVIADEVNVMEACDAATATVWTLRGQGWRPHAQATITTAEAISGAMRHAPITPGWRTGRSPLEALRA